MCPQNMGQYLLLDKYLLAAQMGDWKDGQVERKKKEGWAGSGAMPLLKQMEEEASSSTETNK